jgi:hypothetical protein
MEGLIGDIPWGIGYSSEEFGLVWLDDSHVGLSSTSPYKFIWRKIPTHYIKLSVTIPIRYEKTGLWRYTPTNSKLEH